MFEKFLTENIESFRQRYEGTFGFYRDEKKKRMLCKLIEIGHRCTFVDAGGVEFRLNPDTDKDIGFEFLPPKSQWYNTPDGAMFTSRVAARQFQRGVSTKNLQIWGLKNGQFTPKRVDFQNLSMIYEQNLTPKEAFKKNGIVSLAISPQFALDCGYVYLLNETIGSYKGTDKLVLKLNEPDLWRTELTDAFKALEITAEIT